MAVLQVCGLALALGGAAAQGNVIPPVSASIEAEIAAMEHDFSAIMDLSVTGSQAGVAFTQTAEFVDRWGWRLSGTPNLKAATDALEPMLEAWGDFNVTYENASIPHWEREGMGWAEECRLVTPVIGIDEQEYGGKRRQQSLTIKGLGKSYDDTGLFNTSAGHTAEAIVVTSWADLYAKRHQVQGKIVVYAVPWRGYDITASYRSRGASMAAHFGGVAALSRSAASFSIDSAHTGSGGYMQDYCLRRADGCNNNVTEVTADSSFGKLLNMSADDEPLRFPNSGPGRIKHIPHAGLSVEDSEMLGRMAARGEEITINLAMGGRNFEADTDGRNTIVEIRGSEFPEQIVLVSGHIDSWDVGQGAMDDAGPAFVALQALVLIKKLGLRPKRTLRWVGWTTEETSNINFDDFQFDPSLGGTTGGGAYYAKHKPSVSGENHSLVLELDNGIWRTEGIRLAACAETVAIMQRVGRSLAPLNASVIAIRDIYAGNNGLGIDVGQWPKRENVPTFALSQQPNSEFFSPKNVDGYWDWESEPQTQHFQGDYFFFHHTEGDTMTVLDSAQMDIAAAVVAVHAYAAAQLTDMLPRGPGLKPVAPVKPGLVESTLRQMMNQTSGSIATGLLTAILGLLVGICIGCGCKKTKTIAVETSEMKPMLSGSTDE